MTKPSLSPFNWRGPSQTLSKHGRIKTESQMLKDATRVNPETSVGRSTQLTNSEKAPR